ncbi:MAG: molecular chaperone HtpG, partial [Cyanobacteria bacterium J06641_5]
RIRQLVKTYCDFMPVAIKFDNETINQQRALWKESPQNLTKDDYLEFYRYLYPFEEDPLLWIHLNTDYPFVLNGILFFPKLKPDVEVSRGQIKLFCNQVFVSDNCEEVVPEFLMPLRGAIDSTDIPLNVSRSALTANRTVRRIADYIAKKIGDRLKSLSADDPKEYIRCWQDVGTYVKYGSLKDEKFKKQVEDLIIYRTTATTAAPAPAPEEPTSAGDDAWAEGDRDDSGLTLTENGDAYTTLQAYLDRNQTRHENRVFYCSDPSTQGTYVRLYEGQGLEVLYLDSFIDANYFVPFLEKEHSNLQFVRVDAELDKNLLEEEQKTEIIDPQTNKTRSESIKELFERALNNPKINVRAEALKGDDQSDTPPAMVLLPEAMRRLKEMIALSQQQDIGFPEEHTLLVNTAHPLVQNLLTMSQGAIVQASGEASPAAQLAEQLCLHIYDLALVAQKGFGADDLKSFIQRSNQVLTNLTQK